jgi:hypothetical protein
LSFNGFFVENGEQLFLFQPKNIQALKPVVTENSTVEFFQQRATQQRGAMRLGVASWLGSVLGWRGGGI